MLDGSAHAQVLFETPQGDRLLREITPAVAQAFPPVGDGHAVDVGGPMAGPL